MREDLRPCGQPYIGTAAAAKNPACKPLEVQRIYPGCRPLRGISGELDRALHLERLKGTRLAALRPATPSKTLA